MKARFTLAILGVTALSAPAFAADAVMEEPPAPAPVVQDLPGVSPWAGGYAGVTTGYGWGNINAPSGDIEADGIDAGGFVGYQQQNGQFVYGVEADANYSDRNGNNATTLGRTRLEGTVRARAGIAASDNVLVYGTAGGAVGKTRIADAAGEDSQTALGWTAGAGVDVKATERVFVRGEYRYTDYGSETFDTGSGPQEVSSSSHKGLVGLGVRF
ncbi:MAG: porin family protein [Rhizobiaceae bacterium]|nr:porin family protein [Rhizobiaceae bacterium]MCV0406472.1 porin family protein [Rhizobiaceae bacterium]